MSREQMLSVIHVKQPRQWYESPFSIGLINSCTYKQQNMRLIAVGLSGPVPLCLPPPPSKLNWFRFRKVNTCAFFFFSFLVVFCLFTCLSLFIYLFIPAEDLEICQFFSIECQELCVHLIIQNLSSQYWTPWKHIYARHHEKCVTFSASFCVYITSETKLH